MAEALRSIGSILAGAVGFAIGGPMGFAIGTLAFNFLVPPKTPDPQTQKTTEDRKTNVGTPILRLHGITTRESGDLIRCAKDQQGYRTGIFIYETKKKSGGFLGLGRKTTVTQTQKLSASFALAADSFIDSIIEKKTDADGETVLFDRFGTAGDSSAIMAQIQDLEDRLRVETDPAIKAQIRNTIKDLNKNYTKSLLTFTPVYGAATGGIVAEISDTIAIYHGTEEQPIDAVEATWYDDGVSADRGITKVVFRGREFTNGTTWIFTLRNTITNKREIIKRSLMATGVPESRIYLRSIGEKRAVVGWETPQREPGRNLAESVAASEFHDLHFMPVPHDNGNGLAACAFTDVSRENPTIVVLTEDDLGAYPNTGGEGSPAPSSSGNVQTTEAKPRNLMVSFKNSDRKYRGDEAQINWPDAQGEDQTISLGMVGPMSEATAFAEIAMREIQASEGTTEIVLMPKFSWVAPGCVLDYPEKTRREPNGRRYSRVVGQGKASEGCISNTGAAYYFSTYKSEIPFVPGEIEPMPTVPTIAPADLLWIDGVSIEDEMLSVPMAFAVGRAPAGSQFGGITITNSVDAFDEFELSSAGETGVTLTALNYSALSLTDFNYSVSLRVKMDNGAPASSDEYRVSLGANLMNVGGIYVSYVTAVPVVNMPNTYDLTGLMPGRFGSDYLRAIPIGAAVVLFSDENGITSPAIESIEWNPLKLNQAIQYQAISSKDQTQAPAVKQITFTGVNLKPLAVSEWIAKGADTPKPDPVLDPETGEPLPDDQQPEWHFGYNLRFYARDRTPSNQANFLATGKPFVFADPLNFTVTLKKDGAVIDTRVVVGASAEITVNYTEANLIALYGSVPELLEGEIVQNGTYGAGFVRAFSV